jgi:hypothetical protein
MTRENPKPLIAVIDSPNNIATKANGNAWSTPTRRRNPNGRSRKPRKALKSGKKLMTALPTIFGQRPFWKNHAEKIVKVSSGVTSVIGKQGSRIALKGGEFSRTDVNRVAIPTPINSPVLFVSDAG